MVSFASTAKFPVSDVVPAVNIIAKKKTDGNKNVFLEVTAQNLANPKRLNPPENNYSIWIVANGYGIKNVGQLIIRNAKKINL